VIEVFFAVFRHTNATLVGSLFDIINNNNLNLMFLSLGSIKKPRKHFNLLHLETQEVHFLDIKVSLIPTKNSEEYFLPLYKNPRQITSMLSLTRF
jgi:hypothetical protein